MILPSHDAETMCLRCCYHSHDNYYRWLTGVIYILRTRHVNTTRPLDKSIFIDWVPAQGWGQWMLLESVDFNSWSGSAFLGGVLVQVDGLLFTFIITAIVLQIFLNNPLEDVARIKNDISDTERDDGVTSKSSPQETTNHATSRRRSAKLSIRSLVGLTSSGLFTTTSMTLATSIDCDLYIAESTIPRAGLGIFSGVAKSKGDFIGNGDKAIPVVDFSWHGGDYTDDPRLDEEESAQFFNPLADYVWHGVGMGMDYETEIEDDIMAFWPGVDAMVNCNLGLLNVVYNEGGMRRNLHPGAGGITPYGPGPTKVIRDIPAGGEIFKHYGDEWFLGRHQFRKIPLSIDYLDIVQLMSNLSVKVEALNFTRLHAAVIYDDLIVPIKEIWQSRTLNALFDLSWKDIERAVDAQDMGVLLQKNATRSIDWLNEHGKCIDHIVHGRSTIEGAGYVEEAVLFLMKDTNLRQGHV
jgi:hypothetical protein